MAKSHSEVAKSKGILVFSFKYPLLVAMILYVLAWALKYLDTFVLHLDEKIGEAILTKGLGFILVMVYLWLCGRKLADIGFKTQNPGKVLLSALGGYILLIPILALLTRQLNLPEVKPWNAGGIKLDNQHA